MRLVVLFALAISLSSSLTWAAAASKVELSQEGQGKNSQTQQQSAQPTGETVFKTHCSRCHAPPSSLSPRITGTVVMHMRARARLSSRDEQLLLKYLAP
jgi:cytochrome c5